MKPPVAPLKRVIIENRPDGLQTSALPSPQQMMDKINELVNYVNYLEKEKQNKPFQGLQPRRMS